MTTGNRWENSSLSLSIMTGSSVALLLVSAFVAFRKLNEHIE